MSNTRIIFNSDKKTSSITVRNSLRDQAWLIASYISKYNSPEEKNHNFIITPPLYRLNENQSIQLRINAIETDSLSKEIESVFSLNALAIPAESKEKHIDKNTVRISYSINNSIKLFFRPKQLDNRDLVEEAHKSLEFVRKQNGITVYNKSPYFITFAITSPKIKNGRYWMVAPKNNIFIDEIINLNKVSYQTINDFGGVNGPYNYIF